ncbi:hypothetical protein ACVIJ6_003564 [Bradyrhizobium sp. USDA 4369]
MRGNIDLICPTRQEQSLRHLNATGSFYITPMRAMPVGRIACPAAGHDVAESNPPLHAEQAAGAPIRVVGPHCPVYGADGAAEPKK